MKKKIQEFFIVPYVQVGAIFFGMSRKEVGQTLGAFNRESIDYLNRIEEERDLFFIKYNIYIKKYP